MWEAPLHWEKNKLLPELVEHNVVKNIEVFEILERKRHFNSSFRSITSKNVESKEIE